MKFKEILFEKDNPETYWNFDKIKSWSSYASTRLFKTEQEAKDWIFHQLERSDNSGGLSQIFGVNGPEINKEIAEKTPLYISGKSYKIGKRIKQNNRLRKEQIEVKRPSDNIHKVAQAQSSDDYQILPIKWYSIDLLIGSEHNDKFYMGSQLDSIKNLAIKIKNNLWISAVIVAIDSDNPEPWLVEGQHRTRAMRMLGFKTVPAITIKYEKMEN